MTVMYLCACGQYFPLNSVHLCTALDGAASPYISSPTRTESQRIAQSLERIAAALEKIALKSGEAQATNPSSPSLVI